MKGKRHTTEQKIRILREAEVGESTIADVCRVHQISEQTFHRWKREFGMLEVDQAKQLKELRRENARLKRMLADAEVYDQPLFMGKLKDAAESMTIGGSLNPSAQVTPVIRKPDETLERGLTKLKAGESWLLEPRMIDNNPCHWSPGTRLGVKPGSWYHVNECFGPVLGLIRVEILPKRLKSRTAASLD